MGLIKLFKTSVFQIISLVFIVAHLFGALNIYFSDKKNYCEMTYMFEYPQFVRISVPDNQVYPQYGLYAYSEGRYTERARKMWFDGIPVLFLPGNAGSHMQVRSLASVALRKAISRGYDHHFDFYTINFNEELSGLYGGVLERQTQFTSKCITTILSLYKQNKYTKTVPTSVILIGHSMGGVIAKRLLAYSSTLATANFAITLAAPLSSPLINFDVKIDAYYKYMDNEWKSNIIRDKRVKARKLLISLGSGPRDILVPASYTSSNDSNLNALTTSLPGVWASPDHVSIVWCKQLVLAINKFLFNLIDTKTNLLTTNHQYISNRVNAIFRANRSMTLNPQIIKTDVTLIADAFWYEDNRRIYQISRPTVDRMTYLMIRLVSFPQNRFVAIESINLNEKDWVFGCNAKYVYGTYRHCKQATSLAELSRWTGAAANFSRRQLATIDLHNVKSQYPDWSHVVVKVAPTRKPVVLNIDINDYTSRVINVNLPSAYSFGKQIIKEDTEANSLYYELLLPGFNLIHEAYLLYVEPNESCKATQYHVSAELHVPWAENYGNYHYFTQLKKSPMKLRLFKSNPNVTTGLEATDPARVTLVLDPQCTYKISISTSWYNRIAQAVRNYSIFLYAYIAAILLLAAASCFKSINKKGYFMSVHAALMSETVKPYYVLPFARLGTMAFTSVPLLAIIFETSTWKNMELQYFTKSLLVLPAYMTALGMLHLFAGVVLVVMVCSSQLAHRLLFRIMWRGRTKLAEKVAEGLQKIPMIASAMIMCAVPLSCGAAALAAGAAFYAYLVSKMYEEYLEDYVYKIMAKIGSKVCNLFRSKRNKKGKSDLNVKTKELVPVSESKKLLAIKEEVERKDESTKEDKSIKGEKSIEGEKSNDKSVEGEKSNDKSVEGEKSNDKSIKDEKNNDKSTEGEKNNISYNDESTENDNKIIANDNSLVKDDTVNENKALISKPKDTKPNGDSKKEHCVCDMENDLNSLNFHMLMFLMWLIVTFANIPALLTWARNFKYSMVLRGDTSFNTGLVMSFCSIYIWQLGGPRRNLKHYDAVTSLLFTMAVFILAIGPFSVAVVNYGVTLMFAVITLQQSFDKEDYECETSSAQDDDDSQTNCFAKDDKEEPRNCSEPKTEETKNDSDDTNGSQKNCSTKKDTEKPSQSSEPKTKETENTSDNASGDNCDVCNESGIYTMIQNIKHKLSFNEDIE